MEIELEMWSHIGATGLWSLTEAVHCTYKLCKLNIELPLPYRYPAFELLVNFSAATSLVRCRTHLIFYVSSPTLHIPL